MNIYGYFIMAALVAAMITLVATYIYLEQKDDVTIIDAATIFVPFFLWFGLMVTGFRPKSLSNLILEPLVIFPIIVICLLSQSFLSTQLEQC